MHGKNGYLVTLAEQHSRLVLISKVADKRAKTVAQSLSELPVIETENNAAWVSLVMGTVWVADAEPVINNAFFCPNSQ